MREGGMVIEDMTTMIESNGRKRIKIMGEGNGWTLEHRRRMGSISLAKALKEFEEKSIQKCVPLAKARAMSKGQKAGAVDENRAKANQGPKPTNVATFAKKRKNEYGRNCIMSKGTIPS